MTKDSANLDYLIALVDLLATCAEVSILSYYHISLRQLFMDIFIIEL